MPAKALRQQPARRHLLCRPFLAGRKMPPRRRPRVQQRRYPLGQRTSPLRCARLRPVAPLASVGAARAARARERGNWPLSTQRTSSTSPGRVGARETGDLGPRLVEAAERLHPLHTSAHDQNPSARRRRAHRCSFSTQHTRHASPRRRVGNVAWVTRANGYRSFTCHFIGV